MNKIETMKTRMKMVDDIIKPHLELKAKLKEVESLEDTKRGSRGFGSTGVK